MRIAAMVHLDCVVQVYRDQMRRGKYFLHEHPETAESWNTPVMRGLSNENGVYRLVGHMCRFNMVLRDDDGRSKKVLKPTGWLTNAWWVGRAVGQKCTNLEKTVREHRDHTRVIGGRKARKMPGVPARIVQSNHRRTKKATARGRKGRGGRRGVHLPVCG